jgi:hypothetical protein
VNDLEFNLNRRAMAKLGTTSLYVLKLMKSKSMPITVPAVEAPKPAPCVSTDIDVKAATNRGSKLHLEEPEGILIL